MIFLETIYTETFEEVLKGVPIFDDNFKSKWRQTADERRKFFKNSKLQVILAKFQVFSNPAVYTLVSYYISLLIIYFTLLSITFFLFTCFVDTRRFLYIF